MCRGAIPDAHIRKLNQLFKKDFAAKPAHLGATCASDDGEAWDGRDFDPDLMPESETHPTPFHYEFALPHGETPWTYLLCPARHEQKSPLRKAHMDEVVISISSAVFRIPLGGKE